MRKLKLGGLAVLLILVVALLHYTLPSSQVMRITDSESRFLGETGGDGGDGTAPVVRDVSLIYAETLGGAAKVFRNEDTGFGFPPYFKFNAETLAATAQAISSSAEPADQYAMVTSYGWRIEFLSMFPNVTNLERAAPDATHFPLFNIVFLAVLAGLVGFGAYRLRTRARRRELARERAAAEAAARTAAAEQTAADDLAASLNRGGGSTDDGPR